MKALQIRRASGALVPLRLDEPLVIGRIDACEITIDSKKVSRRHAIVLWTARGCSIKDLGSTNGTFVNGRAVKECALRPGDRIEIGEETLTLISPEESAPGRSRESTASEALTIAPLDSEALTRIPPHLLAGSGRAAEAPPPLPVSAQSAGIGSVPPPLPQTPPPLPGARATAVIAAAAVAEPMVSDEREQSSLFGRDDAPDAGPDRSAFGWSAEDAPPPAAPRRAAPAEIAAPWEADDEPLQLASEPDLPARGVSAAVERAAPGAVSDATPERDAPDPAAGLRRGIHHAPTSDFVPFVPPETIDPTPFWRSGRALLGMLAGLLLVLLTAVALL